MQPTIDSPSPRSAALRVLGTTGALLAALIAVLCLVRPDMMTAAMHAAMHLMP
jgi:hypothetical protein